MNAHGVLRDGRVKLNNNNNGNSSKYGNSGFKEGEGKRKSSRLTFGTHRQKYQPVSTGHEGVPRMNIAILITGSRGDVQPFIALGQTLQSAPYYHRVRIGTHGKFRDFVRGNGLEFFSIGGDPEQLMSYMVKNPGILPSVESFRAGDVGARKTELEEMLGGAWRACTEPLDTFDLAERLGQSKDRSDSLNPLAPFVADAIISNPPTYASAHIAERLSIPLHMMFTMPWSPTRAFPHPLAQMDYGREDHGTANYYSYSRMELLTWTGLADIVNRFRRSLLLDGVDPSWGYNIIDRLKVPYTYCWSEALIPKPADWGDSIGVSKPEGISHI